MSNDDYIAFGESDARNLLDLLNQTQIGNDRPRPVACLNCVMVIVTTAVTAATCANPGIGVGRLVQLTPSPGPSGVLDRATWSELSPAIEIELRSYRTNATAVGSVMLATREQIRNEWWI